MKCRILIVDDHEVNVELLRRILEGCEFLVEAARNGVDALERARRTLPDLVISDLLMPEMDGYSLLRRWKEDSVLSAVPFVVYTATYLEKEDVELAVGLGADDFILKPADPDELVARIRKALAAAGEGAPRRPRTASSEVPQLLERHAEVLIRKLGQRTEELEAANAALRMDVARREAVEASLRQSEWLLRLAGKAARLGGWAYELGTGTLTWSEQVSEIHEVPPGTAPDLEGAIGFAAPEFRKTFRELLEASIRDGRSFDEELQILTARGRRLWVRAIGQAERDGAGAILRIQGAIQDIDDRHRLEWQYRQAQKMEVVGRLAGGVAHDFHNLLTVINGYSALLLKQLEQGHPSRELVTMIGQAGERSAALTRQLLTFSRQEVLVPRVVNINDILLDLDRMLRRIIGEDVVLRTRLAEGAGAVRLDPSQLEQVIMNLAINARDAMPDGGELTLETARVELDATRARTHPTLRAGPHVMLAVGDSGCGMSPEVREKMFEPFFTTKPAGRGTGLGLAVVHGVVKQNGGHIEVQSAPGEGTTIRIYWPVAAGSSEPVAASLAASDLPVGNETVLLVEDDHMVRAFAWTVLDQCGYSVIEATDGAAALGTLQPGGREIHVLVTDVVMPGMGGRRLAMEAQRLRPGLKVLYISGHSEDAIVRHGIIHDELNFLQKPFTPQDLAKRLRRLLEEPAIRDADVAPD